MESAKGYLKFFIKVLVARIRNWMLFLFGSSVNKKDWEKRLLVIYLGGLGDIVMLTGVLKHYKEDFPDKKIYLLAARSSGVWLDILGGFVDHVEFLDYPAFIKNPWHGLRKINALRNIGFQTVITPDPGVSELNGKFIAVEVGAENVIGYEGMSIQEALPLNPNMAHSVAYAKKNLFPKYTKLIPTIDRGKDIRKRIPSNLHHYIASYENAFGKKHADYASRITVPPRADAAAKKILDDHAIAFGTYCLLTLGTSTPHREWGPEKFAEALRGASFSGTVVVAGGRRDAELVDRFAKTYQKEFLNLAGKTTVDEYVAFIAHSLLSLSNDTAPTHIAVALKKPSISILGLGHFGANSLYGYPDINKWEYAKGAGCLCDNWRCIHSVRPEDPTPCIASITVEAVAEDLRKLLAYLQANPGYPRKTFEIAFAESA